MVKKQRDWNKRLLSDSDIDVSDHIELWMKSNSGNIAVKRGDPTDSIDKYSQMYEDSEHRIDDVSVQINPLRDIPTKASASSNGSNSTRMNVQEMKYDSSVMNGHNPLYLIEYTAKFKKKKKKEEKVSQQKMSGVNNLKMVI